MVPQQPKIYHITHWSNLSSILMDEALYSDAVILSRNRSHYAIGMGKIKRRRLEELEVTCHPGTKVGEYVPFYFCPRSIMLYVIHKGNHPELNFRDGQEAIIHLQFDLFKVINWAEKQKIPWAFSLSNAGAYYTQFCSSISDLSRLDWNAIQSKDFRDPDVKERKQAEFLVYKHCDWSLVERIGTHNHKIYREVLSILQNGKWKPTVEILPSWYY